MRSSPQRPCTVVVVEDNDDARELLQELLQLWGHRVEAVATGEEGVSRILASRPDLALVDLGLPGMDGFEVAARAVQGLGRGVVHLVALSGFDSDEVQQRVAAAGFDERLVKPPNLDALAALLRRVGARAP